MFDEKEHRILWEPKISDDLEIEKFRKAANEKYGLKLESYHDLHAWSTERVDDFWEFASEFLGVKFSEPHTQVRDHSTAFEDVPTWFEGAKLNFAENLLRFDDDRVAIVAEDEAGDIRSLTYAQLRTEVTKMQRAMRKAGVGVNDVVVGQVANSLEPIVAMLAATSLGALWSAISPDFGVDSAIARFSQIKPKLVFAVNGVHYNGKIHSNMDRLPNLIEKLEGNPKVVVIPFVAEIPIDLAGIPNASTYESFLDSAKDDETPLTFEQLPFSHPVYVLFSSGTTGPPKCIVHGAGGTLLQHRKEHTLHLNIHRDDVHFYFTSCAWMMWHWLVSTLATGATIVLYDGSPFSPSPHRMWEVLKRHNVTLFGTSAKFIASTEAAGVKISELDLPKLRVIMSTGSVLAPENFDFVYTLKHPVQLVSITGGTDIISCFAGGSPTLPVRRGLLQCALLGMDIAGLGETGEPVYGEKGDLVCRQPFPCMPVFFWNDKENARYKKSYFSGFKNVWTHGDFIVVMPDNHGVLMLGRSDATLNPAGVRFGSAEVYSVLEDRMQDKIKDSVVVGYGDPSDEKVILFVQLQDGVELDAGLQKEIRSTLRSGLSPRHVPVLILTVADVPYTHNGKKVEVAVKRILKGEKITHRGALRNPDALDLFADRAEVKAL